MKKTPLPKNAKERELLRQWEQIQAKASAPLERGAKAKGVVAQPRETVRFPVLSKGTRAASDLREHVSRSTAGGVAAKVEAPQYTGSKMVGIATMHKSNSVPVFSAEEAIEVATMRRN